MKVKALITAGAGLTGVPVLADGEAPARRLFDETAEQKTDRLAWWTHDRFGMFIHFGLYSLPARKEWIKEIETIPEATYDRYFENFDPDLFNAREWVRAAKRAGMKYVVLTAKHHEGFCLWDSKFTDYKVTKTPFGRDLVREFVDACRSDGLKVGLYYSLIDWHHPHFTIDDRHPRRPKTANYWGSFGDSDKDYPELNKDRDMSIYRQYMKDQVTELLTNYGKIDIVWYDFTYPGEHGKTAADWDAEGLLRLTRKLQPGIIVNNRMGLYDTDDGWDFVTPEQFKVVEWPTVRGKRVPWETCQTFSGSWGYHRDEATWKSTPELLHLLVHAVSKGGNLIMNVGPTGRGLFDSRALAKLDDFAAWMKLNGRSVYGCTEAPDGFKAPENTLLTYSPQTGKLYIHLLVYPGKALAVDFGDRIAYAQFLHDASELPVRKTPQTAEQRLYKHGGEDLWQIQLPATCPAVVNPVIEVVLR